MLIVDEIYIAKRVEYSAGEIQGLTADGAVATTLLCFMVKSVVGKYKDLVAVFPIATLTAAKLNDCYCQPYFYLCFMPNNSSSHSFLYMCSDVHGLLITL